MSQSMAVLLLLAAMMGCASAAMPFPGGFPGSMEEEGIQQGFPGGLDAAAFRMWLSRFGKKEHHHRTKDEKVYAAVKFFVAPSRADDFEDRWGKFLDGMKDEKGLNFVTLKKVITDNVVYIKYAEWESMDAWVEDHLESDHMKDWLGWLEENDISFRWTPLKKVIEDVAERRTGTKPEDQAHILVRYMIPPSQCRDFRDTWDRIADEVAREKKNNRYVLRKGMTSNTEFYVYGSWEDYEAYRQHFHSKHIVELRQYLADNDIVYQFWPLDVVDEWWPKSK